MAAQLNSSGGDVLEPLSGELLEKAVRELNEPQDFEKTLAVVEELKQHLANWKPPEEDAFNLTRINDTNFLLRFLRARKFDVDRAEQLFINYHKFRYKYRSVVSNLDFGSVKPVLESGAIGVLENRMNDESKVICLYPGRWDHENVPFHENFRALLLLLEELISDKANQVHGFSVLYNFEGVTIFTVLKLAQSEQVKRAVLLELLQDAFPARFKGIHLVNQPWYVSIVLTILRPFMKEKLRQRLHMHGADYQSLHEAIDPSTLPADFGGEQPPLDIESALNVFSQ